MTIQAVVARVDQIATAQQQLSLGRPITTATAAAAGGAMPAALTGTTGQSVSFAGALASAQSPSGVPGQTDSGLTTSAANGVSGAVIPQTSWNPQQKPIAAWIAPVLDWASQHGWTGSVTSGYRSYSDQASINASGAYSAPAGTSNHETTQYPGGAVDVTDPAQLLQVLQGYTGPQRLVGGVLGAVDPEHFSASGH
jgi:hypothetical protein